MKVLAAIDPTVGALVKLLKKAKNSYYNTGEFYKADSSEVPTEFRSILRPSKGVVTDKVYDQLEDALRELDPDHPLLKAVGVAPKKRKIKLPFNMPSLDKIKGAAVSTWLESHPGPYVVSDKVDGVSLGIKVKGSTLLFTRGDGATGGDISFMAKDLGIPEIKTAIEARGEIVMPVSKFNAIWAEHFANPRNMVSGITNRNSLHEALAHCHVYMYELVSPRMAPAEGLAKLKSLGFRVVPHTVVDSLSVGKLTKFLEKRRAAAKYEMDGLVVTQNKRSPVATSNPDWSVAFKDAAADDMAVATVVEVQWRTTRTGALFPRVVINPVKLKGVTVTYCSGKSGMTIKTLGIGPGAKIKIARSGDVIPDIREVIRAVKPQMPDKSVIGDWKWKGDNIVLTDHTQNLDTANDVAVQQMSFFFTTIGVERFKAATLQKFVDHGIQDVPAVLRMTQAQFLRVPGTSEKVLSGVWTQLQAAISSVELHTLMYASGVFGRNFGSKRFAAILKAIPNVLNWSDGRSALVEAVDDVEGFDLVTAKQFAASLPAFLRWLKSVPSVKPVMPKRVKKTGSACTNQRVVMTGFRDKELELQIVQQGGEVIDSIKKATVLLAKDPSGSSAKLDTARQLKIPIMTADQFRKKFF
jgi:NAD-dependent DNA ligase